MVRCVVILHVVDRNMFDSELLNNLRWPHMLGLGNFGFACNDGISDHGFSL